MPEVHSAEHDFSVPKYVFHPRGVMHPRLCRERKDSHAVVPEALFVLLDQGAVSGVDVVE